MVTVVLFNIYHVSIIEAAVEMKGSSCLCRPPIRYVFTLLAFLGFVFNYTLRININLMITTMVNHTALNDTDHYQLGSERKNVS